MGSKGTKNKPKTVALLCMLDSIHSYRWLANFIDSDEIRFEIFPSGPHRRVHPKILELENDQPERFKVHGATVFHGLFSYASDVFLRTKLRAAFVKKSLRGGQSPDIFHFLEFQHSGYLHLDLPEELTDKTKLIGTNWGSDLYWFSRFKSHKTKIRKLLSKLDVYVAECQRDIDLARELGFKGEAPEAAPNSFVYEEVDFDLYSKRDTIAVKGYQGWSGQALIALQALKSSRDLIRYYNIVVFSSSFVTRVYSLYLRIFLGLNIVSHPKGALSADDMKSLFLKSVIYIGVSKTDGISTSALEALACGAIPIQSSTACIGEWIEHGKTGFSPQPSLDEVQDALHEALRLHAQGAFSVELIAETLNRTGAAQMTRRAKGIYD